ncbi:MAG: hypothetical protein ACLP50_09640 [Solirubrobacteraceae bacterium]
MSYHLPLSREQARSDVGEPDQFARRDHLQVSGRHRTAELEETETEPAALDEDDKAAVWLLAGSLPAAKQAPATQAH